MSLCHCACREMTCVALRCFACVALRASWPLRRHQPDKLCSGISQPASHGGVMWFPAPLFQWSVLTFSKTDGMHALHVADRCYLAHAYLVSEKALDERDQRHTKGQTPDGALASLQAERHALNERAVSI